MMDSASVRLVDSSGYELARAWLHAHSAVMSGGSSTAPAPALRHIKLPPLGEPTAAQLRARRPLQTTKLPPGQHLYLREQRAVMDQDEEEEEEEEEAEGAAPAAVVARMVTGDEDNDEDEGADGEHDGEDDGGGEEGEEEEEEEEGEEEEEEEDGEDEEADPGGAPAAAAAEGCGEAEGMDWSAGGAAASDAPAAGAAADWARDKVLSTTRVEPVDGREGAPVKRELVATSAVASDTAGDHASAGSSSAVASVARDTAASDGARDGARDGAHDGAPKYGSTQNPMIWERQAAADDAPTQERHTTAPASEDGHSSSELHSELHGSPDDHDGAGVGAGATETEMDRRAVGSREPGGGHHDGARDGARDSARDSDPGGVRERRQRRPPSWSREPPQVMAVDCL